LVTDEALDVRAELREILRRGAGAVLLQRAIDDALRQGRIERPARTVSHENEWVSARAVVAAEYIPQHASTRVWTGTSCRTAKRINGPATVFLMSNQGTNVLVLDLAAIVTCPRSATPIARSLPPFAER
jgi:hypothetical protein